MSYLGLGKTKFNSSICFIDDSNNLEILITERFNRSKYSGAWPEKSLLKIKNKLSLPNTSIAENRDMMYPWILEDKIDSHFPFYDFLEKNELHHFTKKHNPKINYLNHHFAHATAALALSPFSKSIIVVIDGAGSPIEDDQFEECSIYLQNDSNITCVFQRTLKYSPSKNWPHHTFGNQIGSAYESISKFIFNSENSSGKVMGLAAYASPIDSIKNLDTYLEDLDWNKSFKGNNKEMWEKTDQQFFKQVASSIQSKFEYEMFNIINYIKMNYSYIPNLIITGGCALNCTFNAKLVNQKLFDQVYIPPNPGDESISLGLAKALQFSANSKLWEPVEHKDQTTSLGCIESIPNSQEILDLFSHDDKYEIIESNNIAQDAANLLLSNNIIAWFQGRSEIGPRALGNRSILANPTIPNLKTYLNQNIKFREDFRPYGASTLYEKAHLYFEIPQHFNNPFMSFAVKVKHEFKEILKEVSHIDQTSRFQSLQKTQNKLFYELIEYFGNSSGLYCLLNTSLNIMDEPILESVSDAKRFMDKTKITYLVIDKYIIKKILISTKS
jgi:carbamoyltransferase